MRMVLGEVFVVSECFGLEVEVLLVVVFHVVDVARPVDDRLF